MKPVKIYCEIVNATTRFQPFWYFEENECPPFKKSQQCLK